MLVIIWILLLFKVSVSPNSDVTDRQQTTDPGLYPKSSSGEGPGEVSENTTENPAQTSTFIPSAKHDVTVSCEDGCSSTVTVEGAASQNAKNAKQPEITGETVISESDALNLSCTVETFFPSVDSWSTHLINRTSTNETGPDAGTSTLVLHNVSAEHSGQYICTAKHPNNTLTQGVNLTLIYAQQPEISGNTTINKDDALNLTCRADSFPPSVIVWSRLPGNKTQHTETESEAGASSFVIHNVTTGQSGHYICTAKLLNNTMKQDMNKTVIYMKNLEITGERDVMEGNVLNLSCTADSWPLSEITWSKPGVNSSLNIGTGAATLVIYNMTAESSGLYICTAKHVNKTRKQVVNVTVRYAKQPEITGETTISEGDALNLTCRVEGFPPLVITWTGHVTNRVLMNETRSDGTSTLVIYNMTAEHSGLYVCTAEHLNKTLKQVVDVTVIYAKQPEITGETTISEGDALNLTCRVEGFPPLVITWTEHVTNRVLMNETRSDGTSTLVIYNMTAEHSGLYVCTAEHLNKTLKQVVDVTVRLLPKILSKSGCEAESDVLTCVCISQGFPLPTIKWPLLETRSEYSFNTAVSNHTVTNTIILTAKDHNRSSALCVSNNQNGETKKELIINKVEREDQTNISLRSLAEPRIIISFFIGVLLSTSVFCLVKLCCRKKQKIYGNLVEPLEMVTSQKDPQINNGEAVEYAQVQIQGTADEDECAAAGRSDVQYSDINVLVLERQILGKAEQKQGNTATEYAQINRQRKKIKKTRQFREDKEEEGLKYNEEEKGSDEGAVYSNVMDLMDQV